jgi:hypothetical protein
MTMRRLLPFIGIFVAASALRGQDVSVPAGALLAMRDRLSLDSSQSAKLKELERAQSEALAKTLAAFLRAEADVIDSRRGDDPARRRAALELRARIAIDAELARMKWEKDSRAVLTPRQQTDATDYLGPSRDAMVWRELVSPVSVSAPPPQVADSGEVRVSVTPNYADIYVNGEKRGTGRKVLILPVGKYEIRFFAVGCTEVVEHILVARGTPVVLHKPLTCSK